ncbi:MAG: hypothetical protein Q3M24_11225 [Candidatus Electrothrix aestuarii]|uniref:Uncharacterized protein n=1 Tax=Candidatus Electrothrix aestuarii TaxID=3062594 RepID=A0AAU8M098_9BACT
MPSNTKELTFDTFVNQIHSIFDELPDYRKFSPNLTYSMKDAAAIINLTTYYFI